jgi:cobalt-precorrin-7 (C5)-methyltransferase
MSKLYVVGVGPGSKEYMTVKAQEIADSADVLVGSKRALELFPQNQGEKLELVANQMESILKLAASHASNGKSVVILSTGDPGFSGILKPILKLKKDVDLEVVPGISSIQLCAARLQIPWDSANLITLHGKGISQDFLKLLENGKPTIILPNYKVNEMARYLMDNGVDSKKNAVICEKLSYPDEKIVEMSLEELSNQNFSYMCVMVLNGE